ncbi:ABC transporter permease [Agrobacterium rhizogenes]|uniref:ABC transporter permease n=1 Tax=Rhizobium rhizogenes TaxID=359 RepID=UPI0004DAF6C3|nr:ABC transporter permease [Rhizobium rhizogenes]OCJ15561.1 peptide ABC transporter permease [Agrobacterium sp. B133/95]KEA09203.1 peptide ABC transporter permease [Rhizobium rhizogenes]MDJ1636545.1 ABC transporter permease [Rhizobium rhizogenes]MQB31119.1 ABC transporter permease [Rhizobium rhizogenes]NTF71579.1 ABC transporter permease [Rhizobium rhizogenes]
MANAATGVEDLTKAKAGRSPRSARLDLMTAICVLVLVTFILAAVFANVLAPYGFAQIDLHARKAPPLLFGGSFRHVLGTDELGRDILSRVFYGLRTSLLIALGASAISVTLGTMLGLLAAFRRGFADMLIRVAVDFQASMPFLIIALAVLAFFGDNLWLFMGLLGLYGWERYARLVRTMAGLELERGYVAALKRNGASTARTAFMHVLPNILSVVLVNLTVVLPEILLQESVLSFLGLGIQPPLVSLGSMVGAGRDYMMTEWWISMLPGLVIFLLSLSISLIGDYLRDAFDPTLH